MSRPRKRRVLRVVLVVLTVMLALIAAVIFGLPALLDTPAVKAQIEHKLSQAVNGKISWDALHIRLLLTPRAVLRGAAVNIPGQVNATVEHAEARLRLLPLLLGRAEIASVSMTRLAVRIDIAPSSSQEKAPAAPDAVAAYRSAIGPLAESLRKFAPDTRLEIDDGSVEVCAPDMPSVQLRNVSVRVQTGVGGADLEASMAGNFFGGLKFAGRLEFADLAGRFRLDVTDVRPQPWLDLALANAGVAIGIPAAELHVQTRTDAKTALECDFQLSVASIQIARAERRLQIPDSSLEGKAVAHARELEVALGPLRFGSLVPAAQARLRVTNDAGKPELALQIPHLDLRALREAVITLVGDYGVVRTHAPRIRSGEISDLQLRAKAETWDTLFALEHLGVSGTLANAVVLVPMLEREVTGLGGHVELADAMVTLTTASAQLGRSRLADGAAHYSLRDKGGSASIGFDLDCAQGLDLAKSVVPKAAHDALKDFESASGRLKGNATLALAHGDWKASMDIGPSDAAVRVRQLPWPVSLHGGRASGSPDRVSLSGIRGALGASSFADVAAQLTLGRKPRINSASGRVTLSLTELYPWMRSQKQLAEPLHDIASITGNARVSLNALTGPVDQPSAIAYDVSVQPEHVRVVVNQLPGPVTISGGAVSIDPRTIKFDRAEAQMLDARAVLSGTVRDYHGKRLQVSAAVSDGTVGEKSMHWIWQRTGAPVRLEPKTPLRLAVERVTWGPDQALDAQAQVQFDAGPKVTVTAAWQPGVVDVRQLHIKDAITDVTLGLQSKERLLHARFSGSLFMHSFDAMFNLKREHVGHASGDMRLSLDLDRRGRTSANGSLQADAMDLSQLLGQPVKLDHIDVTADGSVLRIKEAVVGWAEQVATIKGEVKRGERAPIVTAEIDSPGILLDALLPANEETAEEKPPDSEQKPASPDSGKKPARARGTPIFPGLWPLPVTGQVKVRAKFIEYQNLHVEPVSADLTLAERQIRFEQYDAQLCGVSFPLRVEFEPRDITASVRIIARHQQLEDTARCFSDHRVLITGDFDASADLKTQGGFGERRKNLQGTVHFEARDGRVMKFALLGNILAAKNVVGLFKGGGPQLTKEGFSYRKLAANGHFEHGRFIMEEISFDSPAVGLAATGWISLLDRKTHLDVLVAPFSTLDRLVRAIPIVGYIIGGTLTSVPVGVSGDIRDPRVVPLGPRAIGSQLTGIFTRTLKLPAKLLAPLTTSEEPKASPTEE